MKNALFYSKILLFGEYGIIQNSKGLSIPYNCYNGLLKTDPNDGLEAITSNKSLVDFSKYLKNLTKEQMKYINLNIDDFEKDIACGMYFDSSIPLGYGVGSSGALVAAIYDKYAQDKVMVSGKIDQSILIRLKKIFSIMESFFHGTSSGLDPLNSYLSIPILIGAKTIPEMIGIPESKIDDSGGTIFLLDSGKQGKTAPMLRIFMENMTYGSFQKMLKEEFIKYTEHCIDDFLNGNIKSLFTNIKRLSDVALQHFKPMIPKEFRRLWRQGIETNDYYLKLCGSGGGGYILGFTRDIKRARRRLKGHKIEVVYHF